MSSALKIAEEACKSDVITEETQYDVSKVLQKVNNASSLSRAVDPNNFLRDNCFREKNYNVIWSKCVRNVKHLLKKAILNDTTLDKYVSCVSFLCDSTKVKSYFTLHIFETYIFYYYSLFFI